MRKLIFLLLLIGFCHSALGHHVLGRPSYSLNEDSNTPSSVQVETQVGNYFVNYMVFPAFPKSGEPGRINLYASSIDDGQVYQGEVSFSVRSAGWFAGDIEHIGSQQPDDNVFRQGFVFKADGNYIITAQFDSNGEPHSIDFPLTVGELSAIGPIGISVGVVLVVLVTVTVLKRKSTERAKIQQNREDTAV
jgi:hypothetical protein